ncbi:MAG: AraC family transcriptional regulator [Alphaproteobacteria bacterium]|nr:AraC family transcriptional regulator [Alphaproteobacteria bacterium]
MSWEPRVLRVTRHVRADLTGDLSVPALARVACYSPFHFSRVFQAVQGETPQRFVRRARLERAVRLMRTRPELELGDIAHAVGLAPISNFSRVFKQTYGVAPSAWDRASRLTPGLEGFEDQLAEVRASCPPLRTLLRDRPALRVGFVRIPTPFLDNTLLAAGFAELTGWFEARGVDWRALPLVGMSWDSPDSTPIDQVRYDLGFALPAGLDASGPLGEQRLPAARCVEVHVQGPKGHIALAWEALYAWLSTAQAEPANLPGIKHFRKRPDALGWDQFDLDCSIALAP